MTSSSNGPIDVGLVRRSPALVGHLIVAGMAAAVLAIVTVAQAEVLARAVSRLAIERHHDDLRTAFVVLAVIALVRAATAWTVERSAGRTMVAMRRGLRTDVVDHAAVDADRAAPGLASREATVATSGIDQLEPYVRAYLPALFVAVAVPLAAGLRILSVDWISAAIVVVTVPLIPIFMILIGLMTEQRTQRQWAMLQRLSGHFLDVMEGLPTLRLFGRASAQADQVRRVSEQYRDTTVKTLRIAFLSAFVLELLATLSVAIIAVEIGLRMANGGFDLRDGLVVLLLAPECYLPLRRVGAGFHAAQAGRDAAADLDEVLERPVLLGGDRPVGRIAAIRVRGLDVDRPGRPNLLGGLDLDLRPGEVTAVVGPSGTGKSTTLTALRGRLAERQGSIEIIDADGTADVSLLDVEQWADAVAVVDQRHDTVADLVVDEVRAASTADAATVTTALDELGLIDYEQARTTQLSGGQRRRIQVARAVVAVRSGRARVVLADEPTAHLDAGHAAAVIAALVDLARRHDAIVVAATHDPALADVADHVVDVAPLDAPRRSATEPRSSDPQAPSTTAPLVVPSSTRVESTPVSTWTAIRRVLAVARPARRRLVMATFFAVMAEASTLGLAATAAWLIVRASEMPPLAALSVAVTGVRGFGIGKGVFRYVERLTSHDAGLASLSELRSTLVDHLATVAPEGVPGWSRGDVAQRVVHDVDRLLDLFVRLIVPVVALASTVTASVIVMAVIDPVAGAAVAVVALTVGVAAPMLELANERRIGPAITDARSRLASITLSTTEHLDALVAHRLLDVRRADIDAAGDEVDRWEQRRTRARSVSAAVVAAGPVTMAALVLVLVGRGYGPDSAMSAPVLGLLILWPLTIGEVAAGLVDALRSGPEVAASARRVTEVLTLRSPHAVIADDASGAETSVEATDGPPRLVTSAAIARWPGSAEQHGPYDLDLAPGSVTSVVGPSGVGKSTLAAMLVRFALLDGGDYGLAGQSVRALDPTIVQRHVVWLEQQPWIGDTSVRENLRFARPGATDEELVDALRIVALDTWVAALPRGLDTTLGRGGAAISGGEAQRLALARGLLSSHEIVVLDEPTAHLDASMAAEVHESVITALSGRTVLTLGHAATGAHVIPLG